MNVWQIAAAGVCLCLPACADMCLRQPPERRLVGLELTGTIVVIAMVLLTVGAGRPPLIDLPLALAIMSFGGTLVFVRFLGRHL